MATTEPARRELSGEKAQRIVEAMRASVASRGTVGSTFDHVAREAGVSRGLLHYYFGTKERLLVEVVRRDCDVRMELLERALESATTAEELIAALVTSLKDLVDNEPDAFAIIFELFTLARRNDEIADEWRELLRRIKDLLADALAAKQDEGVIRLAAPARDVSTILFALADGLAMRFLSGADAKGDAEGAIAAGVLAARALILAA